LIVSVWFPGTNQDVDSVHPTEYSQSIHPSIHPSTAPVSFVRRLEYDSVIGSRYSQSTQDLACECERRIQPAMPTTNGILQKTPRSPRTIARKQGTTVTMITAVEDDGEEHSPHGVVPTNNINNNNNADDDDYIPGPPSHVKAPADRVFSQHSIGNSSNKSRLGNSSGGLLARVLRSGNNHNKREQAKADGNNSTNNSMNNSSIGDELALSNTEHRWAGAGILASRTDLELPPEEFAAGCNLLQAAARGDQLAMDRLLRARPKHVNFRDYDRRTALHVAASEGHLHICQYLIENKQAAINRSDRWGGSPLDDAHRHRHEPIVQYLREKGATTGSGNRTANLIKAAADGDVDEVKMLLASAKRSLETAHLTANRKHSPTNKNVRNGSLVNGGNDEDKKSKFSDKLDVNQGDYDKRTALHLASGEGHASIVLALCEAGADPNVEDRWKRRPLDDAFAGGTDGAYEECVAILQRFGAARGLQRSTTSNVNLELDKSSKRQSDNLKINFGELEMIDRIGAGAFGEIYKCRWRGTLVAAKIIKTAKIRKEWVNRQISAAIKKGKDVDEAIHELDEAEMAQNERDLAIADFHQEISVLKSLRHPQIVLLLAYSTTADYEVMISELMKCSLLDVFKSHMVQGTRMRKRTQIIYATQLARGMNYLHTCSPPIIHRDLKPANLLIDHSGVLKISDFGLSKIRPDPGKKETEKYTMTGETGSYRFMAPEVFRHEEYNETVDIYSYAMILFYLLVGRPPWPTISGMNAVKKAAEEGDRPNVPRDMDLRMQSLLKECWDENASMRPAFQRILANLEAYSKEVFHTDSDNIVSTLSPDIESDCTCILL
jgi:serine/threonine protein kinase/ankyrin repeat protein